MKFFQKHRKKIVAILALFLALLMILPAVTMIFGNAGAVTQSEIDDLRGDAADLAAQKKDLEAKLSSLKGEMDSAYDQKLIVEKQVMVIQGQIDNTQAIIDGFNAQIKETESDLEKKLEAEAKSYEDFCLRVRAMEEEGTATYWHVIFGATSFSDLLDKVMMVNEVMEYDKAVITALEKARKEVEQVKAALEQSRAEQLEAKAALDTQKAEWKTKQDEVEKLLKEMQDKKDRYENKIKHLDKEFDDVEAEIKKKQEELKQQNVQVQPGTGYVWPLDGWYVLTSLTGGRIHPVTGKPNNHLGIDVRANYGTPIKAARGGVVIISTYHDSYGNYVVVDHGNGDTTLYAHMSSRSVSVGQTVKQGQVVGKIGSTGSSTGNHLHFEVKVRGVRKDPVNFYPNLDLWVLHNGVPVPLPH